MGSPSIRSEFLSFGKTLVFSLAAAFAINNVLLVNAKVPSGSMESTIMTGDRVMANRLAYLNRLPERFDVVIFKYPDDETQQYCKRIIGMPGEIVEIIGGSVYINGTVLDESSYLKGTPRGDFGPFTIPKHHYFMLGDNRNDSNDSKNWKQPFVAEHKILGKVMFSYYPSFVRL